MLPSGLVHLGLIAAAVGAVSVLAPPAFLGIRGIRRLGRPGPESILNAPGAPARRRFAGYWRVVDPGSALIRRTWLDATKRRAESGARA